MAVDSETYMAVCDEVNTWRSRAEQAEARVAELTGEVAIQNELIQQMVYTESTINRKAIADSVALAGSALLLRKQAEAVEACGPKMQKEEEPEAYMWDLSDVNEWLEEEAARLRQQAEKLEKNQ